MEKGILLEILEDIRISLSFKVKGEIGSHRVFKSKKPYRKYLKKLGIKHIIYEIDKFAEIDNTYCICIWFKNEDFVNLHSTDLTVIIKRLKAIFNLQEEIKGVKQ